MERLQQLSRALKRRGFESEIYSSSRVASMRLLEMVQGRTVGYGGSFTLESLGVLGEIGACAKELYTHLPGRGGEEERAALHADIFLTSANAVSMDGQIVNIDGTGNRVAATCFGPGRVVYLIGRNKIVPTLEEALLRAKEAAVKVAKRYRRKTPCVTSGKCEDCLSPECVCAITTIHRRKPFGIEVSVLLIDEELGF
ncbi:MAG: lactate utilization protein [Chitinispirillaceae bacterium]|nr:lactate utilization protein [Chitinispirillaceae bacterium]